MRSADIRQASFEEIAEACRAYDGFSICGHINPDGDCIGSVLGMMWMLEAMGKEVQPLIALDGPLDDAIASMPGADALVRVEDARSMPAFITVDATADDRLGERAASLRTEAGLQIVIDHHEVSACGADLCRIDPSAASTTCLVWELACMVGGVASPELATCCYTGLMTDTGRFQYQNADARAFRLASQMVEHGADVSRISRAFFQNKPLAALRIEALAIERLELLGTGDIAFSWIESEDLQRLDATRADCEGIIDALRSIKGVRVACVLKDLGTCVRGSLRSKDGTDVSAIAARFGGGGHKAAAGFTMERPLPEAISIMKAALTEAEAR